LFHESNIQEFNYFALENLFLNLFEVLGLFDALFLKLVFFELLDFLIPFLDESSLVLNLDLNFLSAEFFFLKKKLKYHYLYHIFFY
jgi:hypothetical protein